MKIGSSVLILVCSLRNSILNQVSCVVSIAKILVYLCLAISNILLLFQKACHRWVSSHSSALEKWDLNLSNSLNWSCRLLRSSENNLLLINKDALVAVSKDRSDRTLSNLNCGRCPCPWQLIGTRWCVVIPYFLDDTHITYAVFCQQDCGWYLFSEVDLFYA